MILTDRQIRQAIKAGDLTVDPQPGDDQFSPTALDLHVGEDFRRFKPILYKTPGMAVQLNLDLIHIPDLEPHMEALSPDGEGYIVLQPHELVIATTRERIALPAAGMLAARVEGRSRFARLGLVIHMTAPTIHNTFRGRITLEIMNHGPLLLRLRPNHTRICQLILERIAEAPAAELTSPFQDQQGPLGSPPVI